METSESQTDEKYEWFEDLVKEELNLFRCERNAEMGVAILLMIKRHRSEGMDPNEIINVIEKGANLLISQCPERACEFRKELEERVIK